MSRMSETPITIDHQSNHSRNDAASLNWIQFNFDYFKTNDGILKVIQMVLSIICMALAAPAFLNATHFFLFAVVITFIGVVLWSFAYFLGIKDVLSLPINWTLSEFVNYVIATMLLFLGSIIQLSSWLGVDLVYQARNIAAAFVGILDTIAFGLSARMLYLQYKFDRST
ncbi:CKLF-like MARVEL transmembrane domain-containing protein 7 [Chironomus tepperi]|uniref:CKLF-like MARVEL transmembrane domain-containing protein 7 n=1 Tax=Chironomus tepperi TaxID=113505 RepID=UPI00391FBCD8